MVVAKDGGAQIVHGSLIPLQECRGRQISRATSMSAAAPGPASAPVHTCEYIAFPGQCTGGLIEGEQPAAAEAAIHCGSVTGSDYESFSANRRVYSSKAKS
jgi:hypothetical protein